MIAKSLEAAYIERSLTNSVSFLHPKIMDKDKVDTFNMYLSCLCLRLNRKGK